MTVKHITTIAIQGQPGSFHHQVALDWFGPDSHFAECDTFSQTFEELKNHQVDYAVSAIENSLYGSISEVYDLLNENSVQIIGEINLHVQQNLIGFSGTELSDIHEIYSHPVALSQCRKYLDAYFSDAEIIEFHDTAGAVSLVKQRGDKTTAAIASQDAARLYSMEVLETSIEDEKQNFTRFVVLSRRAEARQLANKSSMIITTDHTPGSLFRVLEIFNNLGVNLTKNESRPIRSKAFRYHFFIDVETAGATLHTAVHQLEAINVSVKIIGSYRAASIPQA